MATVYVASARSSYGNTTPGDQNGGREVSREKYYVHSKDAISSWCKYNIANEVI